MYTPSLGQRVVVAGVAIVACLALSLDALLYVSMRANLRAGLEDDLARDGALAREEATRLPLAELPQYLAQLGVLATVRDSDGAVVPGSPALTERGPLARDTLALPGGATVEVARSRADTDHTLRRLVQLELAVTPLVVVLALLLLRLIAEIALRPLDSIAAAARRTAEGHRGERLRPHPTETRLGQMASAYDQMLDALETAVGDAESAHAESDRLLAWNRRILNTAREAFVAVDDSGIIVDWNTEAERVFGWRRDEAIGRPAAGTVVPATPDGGSGIAGFRPPDGAGASNRLVELTAQHRDGHTFPARMTVWTTRHADTDSVSAFIWDITAQLRAEQDLGRLVAVVESADDAVLSVGLDGTILTWNPAAERMFGYPATEAIGASLHLVVPDDRRPESDAALAEVRQGKGVQRLATVWHGRDRARIDVALTLSPVLDGAGAVCAASSIVRDVTDERRIAGRLDESLRSLEEALGEARRTEADTRRFLDDAAHQLRAPITNIRACAEGLLFLDDTAAKEDLLASVVQEAERAGRLMAGLLQMARLNHGFQITPAPCDLVALCRAEAARVEAVAPDLRVTVAGPEPATDTWIDPLAASEIVANLLDNARRHARSHIAVTIRLEPRWIDVEVADDGPGLPAGSAESAFDRFVSLDGEGGSGLGLPIARQMARSHGGDLSWEGAAFLVRLPSERRPAAPVDLATGSAGRRRP